MRLILLSTLLVCSGNLLATPFSSALDSLPVISCPADVTLGANASDCVATYDFTVTADDDTPGFVLNQTAGLPSGAAFPLGSTLNTFEVTDADGNTAACAFAVTVRDFTPPVAICNAMVNVALGATDDPNDCYLPDGANQFASTSWVGAAAFEDGSFDKCSPILLTVQRMAPYSSFVESLNAINGHPPCDDPFPDFPSEFERAVSEQQSIKFYCGEQGTTQQVLLRVYQLNPDSSISIGPNGQPIMNQCVVQVKVDDKIKPVCMPPQNVTVACENFDPTLKAYGEAVLTDNCCLGNTLSSVNYNLFDTLCSRGTIVRTFRAFDCAGNSSSCTQRVVANYEQWYYVRFPDDTLTSVCNSSGVYGMPTFFGENCELMGVSYEDEIFLPILPDACFKIDRTWTVINWCTYDPNLPLTRVPNPTLVSPYYHEAENAPGPIVSACDAPAPWNPTISKIFPLDTVETNFCTFWSAGSNGYQYTQFIRIADQTLPAFVDCPAQVDTLTDDTPNDVLYWNNVFNPNEPAQDLAEGEANIFTEAFDNCSGGNVGLSYLLFLDLDGDGAQETVVNSNNPPPANTVYFGNAQLPNYIGGTPVAFDSRPVPNNEKWRFTIETPFGDSTRRAWLRWNTAAAPNTYVVPELPVGNHTIIWKASDGCGYDRTCEHRFSIQPPVVECLAPADVTVSCENFDPSLQTYGMPEETPNCCIQDVEVTVNYSQFDTICSRGTLRRSFLVTDCSGGTHALMQRIVVNYAQNYFVRFPDDVFMTVCDGMNNFGEPIFFGEDCELIAVAYEDAIINPVPDACIKIERDWTVINWCTYNPGLDLVYVPNPTPNAIISHPSNLPGPVVSACGTPMPWAPTMVKISPVDPSPTNYCTFWQADANGYRYKQFIRIADLQDPVISNCLATPLVLEDSTVNDPNYWNNIFDPGQPAQNLSEREVNLFIEATDACTGASMNVHYLLFLDLNHDGAQETVVDSRNLPPADTVYYGNAQLPNFIGGTPVSFDNRAVPQNQKWRFALERTVQADNVRAAVRWNTPLTPNVYAQPDLPEGTHKIRWYVDDACGNQSECEEVFTILPGKVPTFEPLAGEGFALFQNEPNPFGESTRIRFRLPSAGAATLTVFDAKGKVIFRRNADFSAGEHTVLLEKEMLAAPGVLFYKLESGTQVAWRKMMLIR